MGHTEIQNFLWWQYKSITFLIIYFQISVSIYVYFQLSTFPLFSLWMCLVFPSSGVFHRLYLSTAQIWILNWLWTFIILHKIVFFSIVSIVISLYYSAFYHSHADKSNISLFLLGIFNRFYFTLIISHL